MISYKDIALQIISYSSQAAYNCYLLHNSVTEHFVPNFVPVATRVSRGKTRLAAFGGISTKPPFRRKNLADISYTDRVIALFVPNFVAMATGSIGENAICSIQ